MTAPGHRTQLDLPAIYRAADYDDRVVREMVRARRWVRVWRGCYVDAGWLARSPERRSVPPYRGAGQPVPTARPSTRGAHPDPRLELPANRRRLALAQVASVAATSARGEEPVFTHTTAALLWGLPLWRVPAAVHVYARHSRGRDASRLKTAHVVALEPHDVVRHRGVLVTSLERTMLDVARTEPVTDALVVADACLRHGADGDAVRELAAGHRGRRGIARAREVLGLADGGAESPWESFTRLHVLAAGLPGPRLQIEVSTSRGNYRADMGWDAWRQLIEFDGKVKYRELANGDPDAVLMAEKRRQDALVESGWKILRLTSADFRDVEGLHHRLRALAPTAERAGLTPRPHLLLR